jgi:SAM-dependent methyltransferase
MHQPERLIVPEILDSLDPADPRAIRSRADLRLIDWYLGNTRWLVRQLKAQSPALDRILEIGAGEGRLCCRIQEALPKSSVTGLDLIARPDNLSSNIQWIRGDFFQSLRQLDADACVGSLILHHFSNETLRDLGQQLRSYRVIAFCEPLRSRVPLLLSGLSSFAMSEVTRHDMPASIRAGFRRGELVSSLGLDPRSWKISESCDWRGSLRLIGSQR